MTDESLDINLDIMHQELKNYLEEQFNKIHNKLKEHDEQFVKIDERFEQLIEIINEGRADKNILEKEIAGIKRNIHDRLGIEV